MNILIADKGLPETMQIELTIWLFLWLYGRHVSQMFSQTKVNTIQNVH